MPELEQKIICTKPEAVMSREQEFVSRIKGAIKVKTALWKYISAAAEVQEMEEMHRQPEERGPFDRTRTQGQRKTKEANCKVKTILEHSGEKIGGSLEVEWMLPIPSKLRLPSKTQMPRLGSSSEEQCLPVMSKTLVPLPTLENKMGR